MQEMADPSKGIDRVRETWKKQGRSEKWINQRMTGQETRNKLTDYWAGHEVEKGKEMAILTNIIHQEWTGHTVASHKQMKGLKSQNLRDHMTEAELIFTALAELATRQIAESVEATGMHQNSKAARDGGRIAKRAPMQLEERLEEGGFAEEFLPPKSLATLEVSISLHVTRNRDMVDIRLATLNHMDLVAFPHQSSRDFLHNRRPLGWLHVQQAVCAPCLPRQNQ